MAAKMIKCKTCGAEIAAKAKACPQCGAKNIKPIYKKWWFYVLIALVVVAIAGGAAGNSDGKTGSDSSSSENTIQKVNHASAKAKLEEVKAPEAVSGDYGLKTIEGSLKNISGKTLTYVQVTFALYDNDGAQIGTAVANINNLTKDSVWKYSAVALTTDEWVSFELTETDCW